MRISAKGRYALAAAIYMAQDYAAGRQITVNSVAEKFGISKIYLEQVFSLLKRGGLVKSIKGAQGGYQLSGPPDRISVLDILSAVESSLFEPAEQSVMEKAPEIETTLQAAVYGKLDAAVAATLGAVSLSDLVLEAEKHNAGQGYMYFI